MEYQQITSETRYEHGANLMAISPSPLVAIGANNIRHRLAHLDALPSPKLAARRPLAKQRVGLGAATAAAREAAHGAVAN